MIWREKINIDSVCDYNKIKCYVDPQYIDSFLIDDLIHYIGDQCKLISIEYPYYDSDYLSTYYIFYDKKLQRFPKECYRIFFYKDRMERKLMGYITLRPTYDGCRLGKIYFDPQYLVNEKANLILVNYKCHVGGSDALISMSPHMKQEGDVAVCAHVATWSVLQSFTRRFHQYQEFTIGQIVEMVSPESERMIPSRGLTAFQISQIFLSANFSPVVLFENHRNPNLIKEAIVSYISSGIPLVAVLTKRNHAISIVGLGAENRQLISKNILYESYFEGKNEITTNIVFSSKCFQSIVVNDDNFFPYSMASTMTPPSQQKSRYTIQYSISEIDRLIIPLYSRIQLTYEDIRTFALRLISTNKNKWTGRTTVARIFLASANTYREYINEACKDRSVKKFLINLEMPKFIWIIETSTPESYQSEKTINGLVIIDSTSATINPEPFLFLAFPDGTIQFIDNSIKYEFHGKNFKMPCFNKILKEVN